MLEPKLIRETNVSFYNAVKEPPLENIDAIQSFVNFVRRERRRTGANE